MIFFINKHISEKYLIPNFKDRGNKTCTGYKLYTYTGRTFFNIEKHMVLVIRWGRKYISISNKIRRFRVTKFAFI